MYTQIYPSLSNGAFDKFLNTISFFNVVCQALNHIHSQNVIQIFAYLKAKYCLTPRCLVHLFLPANRFDNTSW